MTSEEWQDLMALMAIIIFADRKIYKEEVDAFIDTVIELNQQVSPGMLMTRGFILDWFKDNREKIKNMLVGPNVHHNINALIHRTRLLPQKSTILEHMKTIAEADSDFHKSEQNVIQKVAKGWNVSLA